jgi:hypothetical protein
MGIAGHCHMAEGCRAADGFRSPTLKIKCHLKCEGEVLVFNREWTRIHANNRSKPMGSISTVSATGEVFGAMGCEQLSSPFRFRS